MDKEQAKSLIEEYLLQACRETIQELDLIDTGTLLNSFQVTVEDDMGITIVTEDYYTYLDDGTKYITAYNITEEIQKNPNYDRAIEVLEEYFITLIEESFNTNN
jgi:hypothetical protein